MKKIAVGILIIVLLVLIGGRWGGGYTHPEKGALPCCGTH